MVCATPVVREVCMGCSRTLSDLDRDEASVMPYCVACDIESELEEFESHEPVSFPVRSFAPCGYCGSIRGDDPDYPWCIDCKSR